MRNRLRSNGTAPSRAVPLQAQVSNRHDRDRATAAKTICHNYSLDNESDAMVDRSPRKHNTTKVDKSPKNKRVAKTAKKAVKGSQL